MSMSISLHGIQSLKALLWEARGTTGVDLTLNTADKNFLEITLFCRQPHLARAYADAINSVGRGHSPYDAELDGVADVENVARAA